MYRRALLGTALATGLAGCSILMPTVSECTLVHERVNSPEDYGEPLATYTYENVSLPAQRVIEETVAEGSHTATNPRREPEEFRYWDTTTVYEIEGYENETVVLVTYRGEGCE